MNLLRHNIHPNYFFFATLLGTLFSSTLNADVSLRLVQPYENSNIPAVKQSFVFGSVTPATATLTVNGLPVTPYTNGGFLTMIPFQEGKFKIEAVATDGISTSTVVRMVNVAGTPASYSSTYGKIDILSPKGILVVRPGDSITFTIQAAPGGKASFRFKKHSEYFQMEEQSTAVQGIYKFLYTVKPDDNFDAENVQFSLKRRDGKRIVALADAKITVQRRRFPRMIELKEDSVILTGPDSDFGYNLFSLQGTRLEVTGEQSEYLRVEIAGTNQGWVKKSATMELPNGTLPAKSISRNIRVNADENSTLIEIPLQFRHPHKVDQFTSPHRLLLTLYGVVADSDRIRYNTKDSVIEEIVWFQSDPSTCVFDIRTKQNQPWGYDIRYEGTKLVIEIRHRPPHQAKGNSMKGLRVALDAGHSPQSFGTIGPWGHTESSVTLRVALVAKHEMEKRGATVIMIQDGTKEFSLQDRVNLAWKEKAHLYISIHADACGEGQDPRELEGYSVHYYHPQSRALAESIHTVYGEKTGLRDQGLWRSNLAVCRMPQMPSLLLEQAFLILPEFEELMITPRHHQTVAESLIRGILDFMNSQPK
ncbi:MAG: hypothetical protein KCHDKBKB_02661 [Elusimicrobia bacterium]|nr:hypothetical protein [Elusimicrobiota bacterium]